MLQTAKKVISPAEIERLACIGWTVLDAGGVNEVCTERSLPLQPCGSARDCFTSALSCFVLHHTDNLLQTHWKTIGPQIKGVKLASFKRQIWVISKKCKEAGETDEAEEVDDAAVADAGKAKSGKGGKSGGKRKAAAPADESDGDDGAGTKKKGTKCARKGKKGGEDETVEEGECLPCHGIGGVMLTSFCRWYAYSSENGG